MERAIIRRLVMMLSLGYILFFYSETMFWARWRPDDTFSGLIMTWLVYSVLAFFVLLMVNRFGVGDVYSVFLVGAVFGWLVEGVVVQTVYADFPFGIVWTPLAWHALISVLAGVYLAGKALGEWEGKKAALFFIFLGIFWGFWASYWKLEDGYAVSVGDFAIYVFLSILPLVVAYMVLHASVPESFEPRGWEVGVFTAVLLFFAAFTVLAVPFSVLILPPLIGVALYALRRLKGESFFSSYREIKTGRYLMPLLMPLFAVLTYAPFMNVWLGVNVPVALATSTIGLGLFLKAVYKGLKESP
ncbi:hypothetical protein E3E36_00720 [Thermococcus sp. M36]|uniref:hypothetical protein n=1 Tax=Thermococcus sp. M36 TaxID=1638261 RepID=UPI00143BB649|nr:hypothetical protein [Thermococcus sp. M36]NJE04695.1 hypothetical protein [Thermococcus sp. M36]